MSEPTNTQNQSRAPEPPAPLEQAEASAPDYGEPWELVSQQGFRKSLVDRRGLPVRSVDLHLRAAQCVNACAGVSDPEGAFARLQAALHEARKQAAAADTLDLMCDEFQRIKAAPGCTSEIAGLCERAISGIKQRVPLIDQRDKALAALAKWEWKLSSVMPADFKDWFENSKAEWPEVARRCIADLRKSAEDAWKQAELSAAKLDELHGAIEQRRFWIITPPDGRGDPTEWLMELYRMVLHQRANLPTPTE